MDLHRVHSAGRLALNATWRLPFHSHDFVHELVLIVEGGIETVMEGGASTATAGMAKLHPRKLPHQERTVGGQPARILIVSWSERAGVDPATLPRLVEDRSGRLRQTLEWMADLWARRTAEDQRVAQHLFEAVLATYAGLATQPSAPPSGVIPSVQEWARGTLARPLALDDLARRAGMSRFHFAREFRVATGQAPMTWLRAQRVEEARALLLGTALPLKAIARRVGFPDEFHLSRVFRRVTGQNPTQVRRLH